MTQFLQRRQRVVDVRSAINEGNYKANLNDELETDHDVEDLVDDCED